MLTICPEKAGFSSERLERIPRVMQRFVDRGDLAGTLTLLARHGQVFHCATTGLMDIEGRRPMQADAIFRIYSMTKPVTVTALLMLLEEGHLLLDEVGFGGCRLRADTHRFGYDRKAGGARAKAH